MAVKKRNRKARQARKARAIENAPSSRERMASMESRLDRGIATANDILLSDAEIARLPKALQEHRQHEWDWLAEEAQAMDIPQGAPGSWERCELFRVRLMAFTKMELANRIFLASQEDEQEALDAVSPPELSLDEKTLLSALDEWCEAAG